MLSAPPPPPVLLRRKVAQEIDVKDLPKDLGKVAVTLLEDPTDKEVAAVGGDRTGGPAVGGRGRMRAKPAGPAAARHATAPVHCRHAAWCFTFCVLRCLVTACSKEQRTLSPTPAVTCHAAEG
jgi:hypothetical protein